ncbi:MAG TPA: sugar phosphate isomerase/epimerase, partial [Candidatus Hydrogenedentes bacterium]|nr:sugar phosphate isomerase/epimerase [Candidatus Hydrogenedentota bacterium]
MTMNHVSLLVLAAGLAVAFPAVSQDLYTGGAPTAESLGWRVGCQAYSFNRFTFYEAVDKTASIGLKYIEAYPGQRLSKDKPEDVTFDQNMSPELQKEVLAYLASKGVTLVNYGVVGISKDEAEARKLFDFAKAMGVETIVSEPAKNQLSAIAKLADEYGIKVAIHNHPKPSMYW